MGGTKEQFHILLILAELFEERNTPGCRWHSATTERLKTEWLTTERLMTEWLTTEQLTTKQLTTEQLMTERLTTEWLTTELLMTEWLSDWTTNMTEQLTTNMKD